MPKYQKFINANASKTSTDDSNIVYTNYTIGPADAICASSVPITHHNPTPKHFYMKFIVCAKWIVLNGQLILLANGVHVFELSLGLQQLPPVCLNWGVCVCVCVCVSGADQYVHGAFLANCSATI